MADFDANTIAPSKSCEFCFQKPGEVAPLQRCASCKAKFYCSPRCQKKDWKRHKINCSPLTTPLISSVSERSPAIIAEVVEVAKMLERVVNSCKKYDEDEPNEPSKILSREEAEVRKGEPAVKDLCQYQVPEAFEWQPALLSTKPRLERLFYTLARLFWIETVASIQTDKLRDEWRTTLRDISFPTHYPRLVPEKVLARPGELSPGEYDALATTSQMKTPDWLPEWASEVYKEVQADPQYQDLGEAYAMRWPNLLYIWKLVDIEC